MSPAWRWETSPVWAVLRRPVAPMLATPVDAVPEGPNLIYEPKWDGWRALAFRGASDVYLQSRAGRNLTRLTLAAIHGVVTVPLHALTIRKPPHVRAPSPAGRPDHSLRRAAARAAMRDPRIWILAAALIAHGAATSTIGVHLVGYLINRGHPATFAATAAGLLGVLSVTGRLVLTGARRRLPVTTIVATVFAVQAAAVLAMPVAAGTRVGAMVTVTGFGLGFGIASLATPALLADRYGTTAYATIAGRLAAPVTTVKAAAPLAAAVVLQQGGYRLLLAGVVLACLLAATGMFTMSGSSTGDRLGHLARRAASSAARR